MCVKIVRSHEEREFNPSEPLEQQVRGAKQVVINYKPNDAQLEAFMDQIDRIIKNGISCQMNIKVNSNNTLKGYQVERKIEKALQELDVNEAIRLLVTSHSETDKKLEVMEELCSKR